MPFSDAPELLADQLVASLHPSDAVRPLAERAVQRLAEQLDDDYILEGIVNAAASPQGIGTHDLAQRSGCSERQINYWTTQGWLHALPRPEHAGSGTRLRFAPGVVIKARIMGALVQLFGLGPAEASRIAETLLAEGKVQIGGITITRSRFANGASS